MPAPARNSTDVPESVTVRMRMLKSASPSLPSQPSDPLAQPVEQGTSVDDQRTTEKIRMALENDTSLSNEAKNVKVITLNKRVTLRGPVTSMEEAQRVEAHAKTVAGPDNVSNQLEIKR